jgi:hypothetical protein
MIVKPILVAVLIGLPMWAQSWDDLRGLKPGDTVRILGTAGRQDKGVFKALANEAITIQTSNGELMIERPRIRRVQIASTQRRIRNVVIGAAIGVAVGAAIDQTWGTYLRNESSQDGGRPVTYAASIGGFAALFGARPAYRTIYRMR